jgi:4a-hydroxytetrahydrobiopterin dehydratase
MDFAAKHCVPCEGGVPAIKGERLKKYLKHIPSSWQVISEKKLKKTFEFKDFQEAMAFVNKVADLANKENHHPDFHVHWNKVTLEIWTHAIGGLSENDFILAAKIEKLLNDQ